MVRVWGCVDFAPSRHPPGARSAPLDTYRNNVNASKVRKHGAAPSPPPPPPALVLGGGARPAPPAAPATRRTGVPRARRAFGALSLRLAPGGSGHWAARGALCLLPTPEGAGKSFAKSLCAVDFIVKTP